MTRSEFTWSFNGYNTEAAGVKALDDMEEWFKQTYDMSEWTISSSVMKTACGYRAALVALKEQDSGKENT